jgi:hypothetical protein
MILFKSRSLDPHNMLADEDFIGRRNGSDEFRQMAEDGHVARGLYATSFNLNNGAVGEHREETDAELISRAEELVRNNDYHDVVVVA